MKTSATPAKRSDGGAELKREETRKPYFRPAEDDTKPPLRDPILRSDPIETEEAVLRLPPLPDSIKSK
ncbi:hypothetical protein C2S52_021075 [Perilla frutescens var. hirtella]|uniref:Uncharacterized protein n=1 Tax=Perilla frutescens var. hirtella TaxID=608512 RepID=A0AAD4P5H0_PERFH|nr:hypothetical protein C2S52_021075 [Perilla frutescens var. hirtella]KAH6827604.1 hypothetical protein C2S53_015289 [Perilla frutescens var. hirtella]